VKFFRKILDEQSGHAIEILAKRQVRKLAGGGAAWLQPAGVLARVSAG
jgi:hypothetical protein